MILLENRFWSQSGAANDFSRIVRLEGNMAYRSTRLPSRFPVGTKFVIESGQRVEGQEPVYSRYIEFPDGTLVALPARAAPGLRKSGVPKSGTQPRRRSRGQRPRPY